MESSDHDVTIIKKNIAVVVMEMDEQEKKEPITVATTAQEGESFNDKNACIFICYTSSCSAHHHL